MLKADAAYISNSNYGNAQNATIETISPMRAQDYLYRNSGNRPITVEKVEQYARAMKAGEWALNGQPIIFDENGDLINGQHRLRACLVSKVSFTTYVIRNISRKTFTTLDIGRTRTVGDNLGIAGAKDTIAMAAAIGWIARLRNGKVVGDYKRFSLTNEQCIDFFKTNPKLEHSLSVTRQCRFVVSRSICAGLHFIFAEKDPEAADIFFRDLGTGAELLNFDPVWQLRESLMKIKMQKVSMHTNEIAARIVRAWNMRRKGMSSQRPPHGLINGQFPAIE